MRWERLWGSSAPPPKALVQAEDDLERLGRDHPERAGAARTLARVLDAAFLRPAKLARPYAIEEKPVVAWWSSGRPCFQADPPALDANDLLTRGRDICAALGRENPEARELGRRLRAGSIDWIGWAEAWVAGRLDPGAIAWPLAAERSTSVLRMTILPVLAPISERLNTFRPDDLWTRGDCPHCGSPPLLAESRGLEQRRYLRCGLCAAGWTFDRLRCPCCDETDHRAIRYVYVEGEQDRYRRAHCATCGFHLKVVATLAPLSAPGLVVAELATAHLDFLEQGGLVEPEGHA